MLRQDAIANAESVLACIQHYATIGLIVAAIFLIWGLDRISPESRESWLFRLLILPGIVGLWPLVLWRWIMLERAGHGK